MRKIQDEAENERFSEHSSRHRSVIDISGASNMTNLQVIQDLIPGQTDPPEKLPMQQSPAKNPLKEQETMHRDMASFRGFGQSQRGRGNYRQQGREQMQKIQENLRHPPNPNNSTFAINAVGELHERAKAENWTLSKLTREAAKLART